jgi:hypothetical protein
MASILPDTASIAKYSEVAKLADNNTKHQQNAILPDINAILGDNVPHDCSILRLTIHYVYDQVVQLTNQINSKVSGIIGISGGKWPDEMRYIYNRADGASELLKLASMPMENYIFEHDPLLFAFPLKQRLADLMARLFVIRELDRYLQKWLDNPNIGHGHDFRHSAPATLFDQPL